MCIVKSCMSPGRRPRTTRNWPSLFRLSGNLWDFGLLHIMVPATYYVNMNIYLNLTITHMHVFRPWSKSITSQIPDINFVSIDEENERSLTGDQRGKHWNSWVQTVHRLPEITICIPHKWRNTHTRNVVCWVNNEVVYYDHSKTQGLPTVDK